MAWGHFAGKILARPLRRPTTFSEAIMRRWLRTGTFKSGLCALMALWVAATCFSTASLLAPAPAMAQLEGEDPAEKSEPASKTEASSGSTPTGQSAAEESLLEFYFRALGWFYTITFLLLSF